MARGAGLPSVYERGTVLWVRWTHEGKKVRQPLRDADGNTLPAGTGRTRALAAAKRQYSD